MSLMSFLFFLTTVVFSSGAVWADDRRLKAYYTEKKTEIIGNNVNVQREVCLWLWPIFKIETVETYYRLLLKMALIKETLFQVRKFYLTFDFLTVDLDGSKSLEFLLSLNIH